MERVKVRILEQLEPLSSDSFAKGLTDRKSNTGKYLTDIYIWQETLKIATEKYKEAWKQAQSPQGIIADDDTLRTFDKGEHIVAESANMSCIVKVSTARNNFDRDAFIASVAKRFKIPVDKLNAMAEKSMEPGAAPVQKRVLETSG